MKRIWPPLMLHPPNEVACHDIFAYTTMKYLLLRLGKPDIMRTREFCWQLAQLAPDIFAGCNPRERLDEPDEIHVYMLHRFQDRALAAQMFDEILHQQHLEET